MSNILPEVMRYYRACYQADMRAVHLLDFFGTKVKFPRIFADESLIDGSLDTHPLPTELGEELAKHLHLHAKEQQLYCFAFFLTGRTQLLGRSRSVCAPLYLIPAELHEQNEVYQISLDFAGMVINPAFGETQTEVNLPTGMTSVYELLNQCLPTGPLDFDELHQLEENLATIFPNLALDELDHFPQMVSIDDLKAHTRKRKQDFQLWPIMGMGVMDKSAGSLGVLNELESLSQQKKFSPVLQYLFTNNRQSPKREEEELTPLPVTLSANQEKIVLAAGREVVSMVNGPPGTGKSFTIAAIAADRLSKGESVLIATKNPQAVEVIADKLERDLELPQIAVRASRKDYRKHLRKRLKDWLYGLGLRSYSQQQILMKFFELKQIRKEVERTVEMTQLRAGYEQKYGRILAEKNKNWSWSIREFFLKRKLHSILPIWELYQQLDSQLKLQHRRAKTYLEMLFYRRLGKAFRQHRPHLQAMLEALRSSTGNQKERYFQQIDFAKVLPALPVWLVDTGHIHQVLPLQPSLFDLVIIDEAGQADMASVLPLLQRAKRAVIVGDPKQLRHVSFLSRERQRSFMSPILRDVEPAHLLSYRDSSILDVAAGRIERQEQVFLLDEHYRSLPDIIRFSNENFYQSELKIMTATPTQVGQQGLYLQEVAGVRNEKGQNMLEAASVIARLRVMITEEESLEPQLCQSVGILSPFRAQVDLLKRILKADFSKEQLARHRVLVGTAHDFQGEERDVMYLSWVVDAQTPKGVFTYLNKEDVFNVSITRARHLQYSFLSCPLHELPSNSLLRQYLPVRGDQCVAPHAPNGIFPNVPKSVAPHVILAITKQKDTFLQEVKTYLEELGLTRIFVAYPLVGTTIDLVVVHNGRTYGIDLVGYPSEYGEALAVDSWKALSRVGVRSIALAYSHWHFDREECKDILRQFFK